MLAGALLCGCVTRVEPGALADPLYDPGPSILAYVGDHGRCTAVAIDAHKALTARHCVGASDAKLQAYGEDYAIASIEKGPTGDIATLTVETYMPEWLRVAPQRVRAGDVLQIWGYGCGPDSADQAPLVRAGVALSDHGVSAATCHGDSGGAVIGVHGLVGIVWGVSTEYTEFTPL